MKINYSWLGRVFSALLVIIISFSTLDVHALDLSYISSESKWNDVDNLILYDEKYFAGQVKYFQNLSEASFYMNFDYYDSRIESKSKGDVYLIFEIVNDMNYYEIRVDDSGYRSLGEEDISKAVLVSSDFEDALSKKKGGKLRVGIQFLNSHDKKDYNEISCTYYCGSEVSYELFENLPVDLEIATTKKQTTTKKPKVTKQKTTKKKTTKSKNETTKFIPKTYGHTVVTKTQRHKVNSDDKATKFSPDNTLADNDVNSNKQEAADDSGTQYTQPSGAVYVKSRLSKAAIIMVSVSALMLLAGVIICVVAFLDNGKKTKASKRRENELEELKNSINSGDNK